MKNARAFLRASTVALAAGLLVAIASPAHAVVAAAVPGSFTAGYATRVVVTRVGGPVTFMNGDVATHTDTSKAYLPKKVARKTKRCGQFSPTRCPLFTSGPVGDGMQGPVAGLKAVKSGKQYEFYCQIHTNMRGTLVVQ